MQTERTEIGGPVTAGPTVLGGGKDRTNDVKVHRRVEGGLLVFDGFGREAEGLASSAAINVPIWRWGSTHGGLRGTDATGPSPSAWSDRGEPYHDFGFLSLALGLPHFG